MQESSSKTTPSVQPVKILFRFFSEMLDLDAEETIWAVPIDTELGIYRIDSIPFYVPKLATDDLVHAQFDADEEMLAYVETVKHSGNSTVWVVILDGPGNIEEVMGDFFELDCNSEAMSGNYFAMEIKAETNYLRIRDELNKWKSSGMIDYAEPCISQSHQY